MGDHWVRTFTVSDPQRHRKGFTVYKVSSVVYPQGDPEKKTEEVVVWKRYSDFQKLHKKLKDIHLKLYLQGNFPSLTKPQLFGRFQADVIEERRISALSLLEFVAVQKPLLMSKPFVNFMKKGYSILQSSSPTGSIPTSSFPVHFTQLDLQMFEHEDTMSQSSGQSTLTDTDSCRSGISSPTEPSVSQILKVTLPETNGLDSSFSSTFSANSNKRNVSPPKSPAAFIPCVAAPSSVKLDENHCQPSPEHSKQPTVQLPSDSPSKRLQNLESCLTMDYMTHAGYHVCKALDHETSGKFEEAFVSYKNAISLLLSGMQDDPVEDRKVLIQKKAAQYLLRAEQIYHNYLAFQHSTTRSIPQLSSSMWSTLEAPISDLQAYKVLGVVATVILALNTRNETPCIIKILRKSPCPVDRRTRSIIPTNVPFMCRLFCYMENEHAVFLVMEQAKGGVLWDCIRPYFEVFNKTETIPVNDLKADFLAFFQSDSPTEESLVETTVEPLSFHTSSIETLCLGDSTIQASTSLDHLPRHSKRESSKGNISPKIKDDNNELAVPDVFSPASESENLPDNLTTVKISFETENILRNSQRLLDSVNRTLWKNTNTVDGLMSSGNGNDHKSTKSDASISNKLLTVPDIKTSTRRDYKSSSSRDRKPASLRRHHSRGQFSCDDMFEGRGRALSRSLDREALQMAQQRNSSALPIDVVSIWAAELVLALDALHRWGVVIGDLRPENLLVGRRLNLLITYQCQYVCVDRVPHQDAIDFLYAAPEVGLGGMEPIGPAADWWSYGALLFELLSGETLASYHPGGIQRYSTLLLPPCISEDAENLIRQLLRFNAQDRLGVGPHGVAKLKSHSFFKNIEWNNILLQSAST